MALVWVRLDTGLPDHPKVLALIGDKKHRSALAYVFGLAYAGRHETDGFIPAAALPFIHATTADARALVDVGLWLPVAGGWVVNSWEEHQPTSSTSDIRRKSLQRASRKGGCVKNHGPDCGCWARDEPGSSKPIKAVR